MIEIKNLSVTFDTLRGDLQAVRDVSLQVKSGEVVCIVGESGSGKSVTALSILKLLPNASIKSGEILIDDVAIRHDKKKLNSLRGKVCSMIFQEPGRSFDPLYSIEKTFHEAIRAHDITITDSEIRKQSIALLDEVGIYNAEARLGNYPHQLSGGQLQRVMIALSIASNPKYLIADEPTTALDVTIQKKIIDLLVKLKETRGLAIVFITHNLSLVSQFADKVVVMYGGMVLEEGNRDMIFNKTKHPYTKVLLGAIPKPGAHYKQQRLISIEGNVPDPVNPLPGCPFASRCSYPSNRNRS